MSDETQKTREIEAEVIRLEVEAEALENEAHDPYGLQERQETVPIGLNQEDKKEIKPVKVPRKFHDIRWCSQANFNS